MSGVQVDVTEGSALARSSITARMWSVISFPDAFSSEKTSNMGTSERVKSLV